MCRLRNIAMRDYQTDTQTDGQTEGRQSDPYEPLCFTGNTKNYCIDKSVLKTCRRGGVSITPTIIKKKL